MAHSDVFRFGRAAHAEGAAAAAIAVVIACHIAFDFDAVVFALAAHGDEAFLGVEATAILLGFIAIDFRGLAFLARGIDIDVADLGVNTAAAAASRVVEQLSVDDGDFSLLQIYATTVVS